MDKIYERENKNNKPPKKTGFLTFGNLKDILIILTLGIIGYKTATTKLTIDFTNFSLSDLLSVMLAFFAIALSVAFYFKATETSNRFYDNSYKFTKDMSEILGRIESGFGEKLRHIDEGYVGLRDRFDKIPFDINQAKEEEQKEQKEIQEKESAYNKLISELMESAKLGEEEKEKLREKLSKYSDELRDSRNELTNLRSNIIAAENRLKKESRGSPGFENYLTDKLYLVIPPGLEEIYSQDAEYYFQSAVDESLITNQDIAFMRNEGLVSPSGGLTFKGIKEVRRAIDRIRSRNKKAHEIKASSQPKGPST